jgi:hypothetical protein
MNYKSNDFFELAVATGVPDIIAAVERINARKAQSQKRAKLSGFRRLIKKIHRRIDLEGAFQVAVENGVVVRWVWCGPEFTDKVARSFLDACDEVITEEASQLKELRLVSTSLNRTMVGELTRALPYTKITVFSELDEKANWRISQAAYCGENPAEWDEAAPAHLKKIRHDEF